MGLDLGARSMRTHMLELTTAQALRNLETFWIVGVVEQYPGFEEVLRRSLDPIMKHRELWKHYAERQYNS